MADIHSTAIVHPGAEIAESASIGPYCIVGAGARLGEAVRLHSHVVVGGRTSIGDGCEVFPFASVGLPPQDRTYRGEPTRLEIGRNCVIREHATINLGTKAGGLVTRIGDNCLFMVGAHVRHDCDLGNNVTLVNSATLGGHCHLGDHVVIGGLSAVHQSVRVGEYAFVGGLSAVVSHVIPFALAVGNRAHLGGVNVIGLGRHGFPREAIHRIRRAYHLLFAPKGTLKERLAEVEEAYSEEPNVRRMVEFVRQGGRRAFCTPRARAGTVLTSS